QEQLLDIQLLNGRKQLVRLDLAANSLLNKLIRQSLVESSHRVEVLQKDPSSPLYSVKTFEELRLKEELLKGIYAMGFNRPSKIQEMALPMMLAHPPQNLIAQSQSGTGKTAAFVLAMLSRVNALKLFPQCLCLAPTYELALQTGRVVERMGKFCVDVQVMYAIRGNRIPRGTDVTKQIVTGTPGTVLDSCFKRKLIDLTKIRVFVLDEADVMIDTQGFADQSIRIQRICQCQRLGSNPGLRKSPGEGNGNPLQYSCLGNAMDREAWRATVHGSSYTTPTLTFLSPRRLCHKSLVTLMVSINIIITTQVLLTVDMSLVAQSVKRLPAAQETRLRSLGREDPREKELATHSSILAWRIPWTEEPGRIQSMGLQESDTTSRCFQKRLAFESVDWVKRITFTNEGGHHLIH
ncbi:hypothetical protein FD755_023612, partial [Muntiacus reevesi]